MKMGDLIRVCYTACPKEISWDRMRREAYGAYGIEDHNKTVKKVLYCVTPSHEIESYAKDHGYDLVISHHPTYACRGIPHLIFHTALDCCEGGLNDMWRDHLGLHASSRHFDGRLGWSAGCLYPSDRSSRTGGRRRSPSS